eukprot:scaffold75014_cov19-Tisochrysis_lutea.AAC.4
MTPAPSGTQAGTLHARADTAGAGANAILLQPAAVHVLVGHGDGRANAKLYMRWWGMESAVPMPRHSWNL